MTNQEISRVFYEMGAFYEMKNERFKARAYDKVALLIDGLPQEVNEIYLKEGIKGLVNLPGVGKRLAEHIEKLLTKGSFSEYQRLRKDVNVNVAELLKVEGVGPRNIKTLWEALEVRNVDDLERVAKEGEISKLRGFGIKSQQKILKGIEFYRAAGGRKLLGHILPRVRHLKERIEKFSDIKRIEIAGSLRRRKEIIGDVDFLATSKKPEKVIEQFVKLPMASQLIAKGKTKGSVKLVGGVNADLRVVDDDQFGAALLYFTGSQAHNIKLRHIALTKGWKLNEYGLFEGEKNLARGFSEAKIYEKLGLKYIEPEIREDTGEIEAAQEKKLPKLINYGDLRGDLQVQTSWSDGKSSIEEMANEAINAGLEYIAITDHTQNLAVANGLTKERLLEQINEIDNLNKKFKSASRRKGKQFRILKGTEVDILKDGTLDLDDETLAKLDVVGASIHNHFELPKKEQTERVIRAMQNPNVDIIFHLTTRIIGKRQPIELDMDQIFAVAKETNTVLEINAFIDRLDINEQYIRKCIEKGIKMSIDSDAHVLHHYDYLEYGIGQARRGWASKENIINAWPVLKMLKMLK